MKKFLLTILAGGLCLSAAAIPAKPGNIPFTLPDGTTTLIQVHGDEFYHYVTDTEGRVISLGKDGFFHSAEKPSRLEWQSSIFRRRQARTMRSAIRTRAAAEDYPMTHGTRHIPVLLVSFSDRDFSIDSPHETFERQLNENGYSSFGATGSVQDFYIDNSQGVFTPIFDVYGPVEVSRTVAYYGRNDDAALAIYEAAQKLDDTVDFSQYDTDGDGNVDMLLLYYAGYNEAEGAQNTIWPHSWDMSYSSNSSVARNRFDGVHIGNYFCTSELTGTSGTTIDGVGTTCHEFGHSLGLPDFYDTDYSDHNGEAGALYNFSTMDSGPYNNDGRTPPYFNAEERRMLGWEVDFEKLPIPGEATLTGIQDGRHVYYADTSTEGEYFVYECRNGKGWDAYIQPGLLVYHVDKSTSRTVTIYDPENSRNVSVTPHDLWYDWETYNCINENASHPCFYLVPATMQDQLKYSTTLAYNPGQIPFPGTGSVTSYTPVDWNKSDSPYRLPRISYSGGKVVIQVVKNVRSLSGRVTDTSGQPIVGATVSLYAQEPVPAAVEAQLVKRRVSSTPLATATTGSRGDYFLEITDFEGNTFDVTASAPEYISSSRAVTSTALETTANFILRAVGEPEVYDLSKFNPSAASSGVGYGYSNESIMGAVGFTAEELAPYAGRRIDVITFMYTSPSVKGVYAVIDFGSERVATVPVDNPVSDSWLTVDVSGKDLHIPDNKDVWFGYALDSPSNGYPLLIETTSSRSGGFYYGNYSLTSSSWRSSSGSILVSVSLAPSEIDMAYLGYNYIENPGNGVYHVGDYFNLKLVESYKKRVSAVQWYFDDEPVAGDTIRLTAGSHTVEARLTLTSGTRKIVELPLTVE